MLPQTLAGWKKRFDRETDKQFAVGVGCLFSVIGKRRSNAAEK